MKMFSQREIKSRPHYSLVKVVTVIHRISAHPKAACVIVAMLEPAAKAAEACCMPPSFFTYILDLQLLLLLDKIRDYFIQRKPRFIQRLLQ